MLIAISQRNDENKHGDRIDNLENNYINYLETFGIKLITIPNSTKNIEVYFNEFPIQGIILSGGNDINPELYGKTIKEGLDISNERDLTEKKMIDIAIEKKLPVLGICRGMQFINVYFKGKLKKIDNHIALNHNINIDDKSKVLDEKTDVNSYHGYGISDNELSNELNVFAKCSDGIIEGIYHPSLPIAGIQWHPERKSPDEIFNKKIIKSFLNKGLFWI